MVGLLPKVNHRHVTAMALAVLKEKRKIVSPFPPLLPGFPSSYCDVCCLKCHKLAMIKTMKVHQSLVLWGKNVHRAFSAVSFAQGDADLLEGCCLLCDEVSEVLSDDEQMGLCPTEVGDCFLFPFFCPLPGFLCRLLRDWFCLFKDGPKELVGLEF